MCFDNNVKLSWVNGCNILTETYYFFTKQTYITCYVAHLLMFLMFKWKKMLQVCVWSVIACLLCTFNWINTKNNICMYTRGLNKNKRCFIPNTNSSKNIKSSNQNKTKYKFIGKLSCFLSVCYKQKLRWLQN